MTEREWYYVKDGQRNGPVSEDRLVELFRERALGPATEVWTQQLKDWRKASEIEGLVPSAPLGVPTKVSVSSQSSTPTRPSAVTVFGVLNIVLGSLGFLSIPCGIIGIFAMPDVMIPNEGVKVWLLFSDIVGLACTILLIVLGIGLLKLRAWARIWSLGYGWFAIVWAVLGALINIVLITSGAYGYSEGVIPGPYRDVFGVLIGLVYPILLVVFMHRPQVKNACTR